MTSFRSLKLLQLLLLNTDCPLKFFEKKTKFIRKWKNEKNNLLLYLLKALHAFLEVTLFKKSYLESRHLGKAVPHPFFFKKKLNLLLLYFTLNFYILEWLQIQNEALKH